MSPEFQHFPVWARAAALSFATLVLAGCSAWRANDAPARHVVVVMVDSLRADHLPIYGYERDTAPFLSRLAEESVVFENAVSTSSYTAEAISSLFTGRYPSATPWGAGWHARPSLNHETMATLFKGAGYQTALFSETPMLDHAPYYRGFDKTVCLTEFGASGQAPELVAQALDWLADNAGRPTLLYLHILDPHAPYAPGPGEYERFVTARPPDPLTMHDDLRRKLSPLKAAGFGPGDPRFENVVQRYDAEIAFVDGAIESLFEGMDRLGVLDSTLAVITADHGEEFLDHGYVEHAWKLYPETYRVPMLFWRPGLLAPERVEQTVSLVDVLPSLLHLEGVPGGGGMNGSALFREEEDGGVRPDISSEPRIMELLIQSRCLIRGVVTDDELYLAYWKYLSPEECEAVANLPNENRLAYYEGRVESVDPWGPIVREEYYDLKSDPGCTTNLAADHPEAIARWRAYLEAYRASCPPQLPSRYKATLEPGILTPEQEALLEGVDPAYLEPPPDGGPDEEMLRSLGYL